MRLGLLGPLFLLCACSGDQDGTGDTGNPEGDTDTDADADTDTDTDADADADADLEGYAFESRFDGADSVATSGQVFRQLLIEDMKTHLGDLTDRLNTGFFPLDGEVESELDFYFTFDSATSGAVPIAFDSTPPPLQAVYDDVATDKDLVGKIAGNDAEGQHQDWSTAFAGWPHPSVTTPESLVRLWMGMIDDAAVEWSLGNIPLDPDGNPVPAVYVTANGLDLQQLLEKFLRGAVAYSQGTDDYLDDDTVGKGLLSDHTKADDGRNYTALEHAWDEGFGYFGAARTYGDWTDALISDPGTDDVDMDGSIDLSTEVCWGHSANAAKRDAGAVAPTDFTQDAWDGFYDGRALLASLDDDPDDDELAELQAHRDKAVAAWANAVAATVVHYINDVIRDMDAIGTKSYSFADHTKHWAELKGFALALQFNPRSPLTDNEFTAVHASLGTAPVLSDSPAPTRLQYKVDLLTARALIGSAYGFDPANLGDDDGLGGW